MLSWTYYYLSLHPECYAKMRTEHDNVFGTDKDHEFIARMIISDPGILGKLEYTTAVLKEVLRLRPIADGIRLAPPGYIIRTATGAEFDTTGTILNIQHLALHSREEIWGPTAANFIPERFMPGRAIPAAYMPFATRPRDCIGRSLAYLEELPTSVRNNCREKLCWHLQSEILIFIGSKSYIKYIKAQYDQVIECR